MSRKRRLKRFTSRFTFRGPADEFGVEREFFFVDQRTGLIVPCPTHVMATLVRVSPKFTYELSACQGESRHGPCKLIDLKRELQETDRLLQQTLEQFGLRAEYIPVAPVTIPLAVYQDPQRRYARIAADMSQDVLSAACRAAGTHVHRGMRDHESALEHHNRMCERFDELVATGDTSQGERIALYGLVKPDWRPRRYASWSTFYDDAARNGFEKNPRNNWKGMRIARDTHETRVFDSTNKVDLIVHWAELCRAA